jgi:hypothetical protein
VGKTPSGEKAEVALAYKANGVENGPGRENDCKREEEARARTKRQSARGPLSAPKVSHLFCFISVSCRDFRPPNFRPLPPDFREVLPRCCSYTAACVAYEGPIAYRRQSRGVRTCGKSAPPGLLITLLFSIYFERIRGSLHPYAFLSLELA